MKPIVVLDFVVEKMFEGECSGCVGVRLQGISDAGRYIDQEVTIEVFEEDAKSIHIFQRLSLELREIPIESVEVV